MNRCIMTIAGASALMLAPAAKAQPQPQPIVKVGTIESDSSCSMYESSWGHWLVVECQENFPDLRARIQSALAESGKLALSTNTGGRDIPTPDVIVTGRISGLGMTATKASAKDYCVGKTMVTAHLDLRARDAHGRIIHATTITKNIEIGSEVVTGSSDCSTRTPWRASYGKLQREVALAAARSLTFKLLPLQVTGVDNRRVMLNYGAPLLSLGTIVQVTDSAGYPMKYRITATMGATSTAEPMGRAADISVGASASVIESDDPAANGRRFEKVELPL